MSETGSTGANPERDQSGKFLPGNKTSHLGGRPPQTNKAEYLSILQDELTESKWRIVIQKAIDDASGDNAWNRKQGREFLAKYVLPQKLDTPVDTEAIIAALLEGREIAKQNSGGQLA